MPASNHASSPAIDSPAALQPWRSAFADLFGVQLQSNVCAARLDGSVSMGDCAIWANATVGGAS